MTYYVDRTKALKAIASEIKNAPVGTTVSAKIDVNVDEGVPSVVKGVISDLESLGLVNVKDGGIVYPSGARKELTGHQQLSISFKVGDKKLSPQLLNLLPPTFQKDDLKSGTKYSQR